MDALARVLRKEMSTIFSATVRTRTATMRRNRGLAPAYCSHGGSHRCCAIWAAFRSHVMPRRLIFSPPPHPDYCARTMMLMVASASAAGMASSCLSRPMMLAIGVAEGSATGMLLLPCCMRPHDAHLTVAPAHHAAGSDGERDQGRVGQAPVGVVDVPHTACCRCVVRRARSSCVSAIRDPPPPH